MRKNILWIVAVSLMVALLGCEAREVPTAGKNRSMEEQPPHHAEVSQTEEREEPLPPSLEETGLEEEVPQVSKEVEGDPYLLEILWHTLQEKGVMVGSPQEITLSDLDQLEGVVLNYQWVSPDDDYRMDGSLLQDCKNLRQVECFIPLKDYSIFEGMGQLESLSFDGQCTSEGFDLSQVKLGKAKELIIHNFGEDMALDLAGTNVERLELLSWSSGITSFAGCEKLKDLSIRGTTTDTAILTAEAFPELRSLDLNLFSDTPRTRDLSQLGTFSPEVEIQVKLDYQACNEKTLASLAGIPVDRLVLDPYNGIYPLGDPDPQLIEAIPAGRIEIIPQSAYSQPS